MRIIPDYRTSRRGFTVVEILVVVAVMGLLAAISIAAITGINQRAVDAKDRRNAQFAAMLYSSARAAGATFSSNSADTIGVINELMEGKSGIGQMSTVRFQLSGVSPVDANALARFLAFDGSVGLLYQAGGD